MVNWNQIGNSFAGIKNWIKVWILVLILVNGCSIFFLTTPIGQWTAMAAAFIAISNSFLIILYGGLTRALAIPHLVWIPLIGAILVRLYSGVGGVELSFGVIVGTINAISLVFDFNDCAKWMMGKREVLGLRSTKYSQLGL